jgi:hypothetical protein
VEELVVREETWLVRSAYFVQYNWSQLLTAGGTAGSTVTGALLGIKNWESVWTARILWGLFVLFVLLTLGGIGATLWRTRGWRSLEEELEALRSTLGRIQEIYTELFEGQLAIFSGRTLEFGHSERISVYRHEEEGFVIVGRYSANPEFSKKPGRVYPHHEGVIGKAWQEGYAEVDDLPDPESEPEEYFRCQQEDWGIERALVERFTMKSRNYVAFALKDPVFSEPIAVIVFESTEVGRLSLEELAWALTTTEGQRIVQFLISLRSIEPRLSYASREDL